ncbi:hypothetical protein GCM10028801_43190 [Nocardioides maradonensis]
MKFVAARLAGLLGPLFVASLVVTGAPAAFDYVFSPWAAYLAGTGS